MIYVQKKHPIDGKVCVVNIDIDEGTEEVELLVNGDKRVRLTKGGSVLIGKPGGHE